MPDPAPEPSEPDQPHILVRWRYRDDTGRPYGQWHRVSGLATIEAAIAFQHVWLADLDVEVRVVDGASGAP